MNKVIITGRWTADPKISATSGENPKTVAKGSIAVDRWGKDNGADFPSVVAFGKIAEHIEKYYHKGMKANICGHIQTGSYEGKNGKVYTTDIVIDEIEFGESKGEAKPNKPDDEFIDVAEDDELPFN